MPYGCEYGSDYGLEHCAPDNNQGAEWAALPDTVFLGKSEDGTLADLASDRSQNDSDMTADTGWIYDPSPSTRTDLGGQRTIDMVVEMDAATATGFLWRRAPGGGATSIQMSGAGVVQVGVNSGFIIQHTLENTSGTERFVISFSTEENPDTTGASDAYRSELVVKNETQGTTEIATATHAAQATGAADFIFGARLSGGSNVFSGTIFRARVSSAFHDSTELHETWSTPSSQPSIPGESRLEQPVPDRSSGLGDDGQFGGPVYLLAAENVTRKDLLLASPLVNRIFSTFTTWDSDDLGGPLIITDADDTDFQLFLPYLFRSAVPPTVNRAKVRVFVQTYHSGGGDPHEIQARCYSMNRPCKGVKPATSPDKFARYYCGTSIQAEHGSGSTGGAWYDLGELKLARDKAGFSYLVLGFYPVGGGSGSLSDQKWIPKALTIDPIFVTEVGESPAEGFGVIGG